MWLFGYGSLIWRPAFAYRQRHPAVLTGWTRRFWQGSPDHRGTPEAMGRVVTLLPEERACCWGMVYELEPAQEQEILARLDHRESGGYERHQLSAMLPKATPPLPDQLHDVLVYVATPDNPHFLGESPLEEMAAHILRSRGPSGENIEYLLRLDQSLREMGADDPHVFALAEAARRGLSPTESSKHTHKETS